MHNDFIWFFRSIPSQAQFQALTSNKDKQQQNN